MKKNWKRFIAVVLVGSTTWAMALPRDGWAMLAPAKLAAASQVAGADRANDMRSVQNLLEMKVVQQRLADLGLSPDEANRRLSKLSDQQLHQVAMQINQQSPAGDGTGLVITVLVIGILVALFVYLLERV